MTYKQAQTGLHRLTVRAVQPGLRRTRQLLSYLKHPDRAFPIVHITGTNGKGSVAALLSSVLLAAGYKVGRFTSPHLSDERERICIQGEMISKKAFTRACKPLLPGLKKLCQTKNPATTFEAWTALAAEAFKQAGVDIAVVEVGMGGRLDATTVWERVILTLMTNVQLEHTAQLGKKKSAICREKLGITRLRVPLLSAETNTKMRQLIRRHIKQKQVPVFFAGQHPQDDMQILKWEECQDATKIYCRSAHRTYERLLITLPGVFQVYNAALAILALEQLGTLGFAISIQALRKGFLSVEWPGRLERVSRGPDVYLDGAHNPAAIWAATERWRISKEKITVIAGIMRDKDVMSMCRMLGEIAGNIITVAAPDPRALSARELTACFAQAGRTSIPAKNFPQALQLALRMTPKNKTILITGSLYNIEAARKAIKNFNLDI